MARFSVKGIGMTDLRNSVPKSYYKTHENVHFFVKTAKEQTLLLRRSLYCILFFLACHKSQHYFSAKRVANWLYLI